MRVRVYFKLVLLIVLPGCVGSRYTPPTVSMPHTFLYDAAAINTDPIAAWWSQFNDPVLTRLIERAVKANYDLRSAREQIEESRALYRFKQAELYPQIDGIAQVRRTRFSQTLAQTSFLTDPNVSFFQFGTDAFWELDFWGRLRHEQSAQYFAYQAQIEQMRDMQVILVAEVAARYVDLCSSAQKISLLCTQVAIDRQRVALQLDRGVAGLSSGIAIMQAEQRLETIRNRLKEERIICAQLQHKLAVLLGLPPEQFKIARIRNTVPLSQYRIAAGMPSDLLRRRPDIRQAERLVASAHETVGAAVAEWFPRFTLLGGVTTEASKAHNWFGGDSLSWFIGPSVRWPLINFGRIKANITVAESKKRQAVLQYSNTVINALKDVEDFLVAYCQTKEQLLITLDKLKEAIVEQRLIGAKYRAGLSSKLEYLDAQENALGVRLELVSVSQAFSTALIGIYKSVGGGW